MVYTPFFSLQNAVCFIILTYLIPVLFTFYIQGVLKRKKNNNSGAKKLTKRLRVSDFCIKQDYEGENESDLYIVLELQPWRQPTQHAMRLLLRDVWQITAIVGTMQWDVITIWDKRAAGGFPAIYATLMVITSHGMDCVCHQPYCIDRESKSHEWRATKVPCDGPSHVNLLILQ